MDIILILDIIEQVIISTLLWTVLKAISIVKIEKKRSFLVTSTIILLALVRFVNSYDIYGGFSLYVVIALYALFITTFLKVKYLRAIVSTFGVFVFIFCCSYLTNILLSFLLNISFLEVYKHHDLILYGHLITKFLQLFGLFIAKYFIKDIMSLSKLEKYLLLVIEMIIFVIIICFYEMMLYGTSMIYLIAGMIASIILMIVVIKNFIITSNTLKQLAEQQVINMALKYEKREFERVQNQYKELRKLKHDLSHVCTYIKVSLEDDIDKNDIMNELKEYIGNIQFEDIIVKSDNIQLDYIINSKIELAKQYDITFNIQISDTYFDFISLLDLYILLGNILDNAIENNKFGGNIEIIIKNEINYKLIKVANQIGDEKKLKIKNDANKYGIGITTIEHIANKYDGYVKYESNDEKFTICVWLPIK